MSDNAVLLQGDCLEVLKELPDNSVDSLITDPPAGISFMGKKWDDDKGGRKQWVAWMSEVMTECLRVLKPGAHGLVWAIPRTSHWTASALEDAGFEIRDVVTHVFGSGFPKSMDISKAIDKQAGAEGEVIGINPNHRTYADGNIHETGTMVGEPHSGDGLVRAPSTPDAKKWAGFGTALKPASEHWILVRKPCSEDTVAKNVLKHGVGGINIDISRINGAPRTTHKEGNIQGTAPQPMSWGHETKHVIQGASGRFPANFLLSHNPDCVEMGTKTVKPSGGAQGGSNIKTRNLGFGETKGTRNYKVSLYNEDGTETVAAFECTPGCAVAELDRQSGMTKSGDIKPGTYKNRAKETNVAYGQYGGVDSSYDPVHKGDSGGASRFFYVAKASKKDKGADNTHPTVKSSGLMSYLIKLITPPGGIVLDPFMGSGSTGVAAVKEGFDFIGIEKEEEYFQISQKRVG